MAQLTPMPSLTLAGWIYDTRKIIDMALSHAFVSDASHSSTCPGTITSFQSLVQKHENQPDVLATNTQASFQRYLERYIPSIRVDVTHIPENKDDTEDGRYILTIKLSAIENGETLDMSEALTVNGSTFNRIRVINNEGA